MLYSEPLALPGITPCSFGADINWAMYKGVDIKNKNTSVAGLEEKMLCASHPAHLHDQPRIDHILLTATAGWKLMFRVRCSCFFAKKQDALSRRSKRKVWNPNRQAAAEQEDKRDRRTGSVDPHIGHFARRGQCLHHQAIQAPLARGVAQTVSP